MNNQHRNTCRQCGFVIVEKDRYMHAQHRGFCTPGCEEVYDAIHEMEYREAEKDMDRRAA